MRRLHGISRIQYDHFHHIRCRSFSCVVWATIFGRPRYRAQFSTPAYTYCNSRIRRITGCWQLFGNYDVFAVIFGPTIFTEMTIVVGGDRTVASSAIVAEYKRNWNTASSFIVCSAYYEPGLVYLHCAKNVAGKGGNSVIQREKGDEPNHSVHLGRSVLHRIVHIIFVVDSGLFVQKMVRLLTKSKSLFPLAQCKESFLSWIKQNVRRKQIRKLGTNSSLCIATHAF